MQRKYRKIQSEGEDTEKREYECERQSITKTGNSDMYTSIRGDPKVTDTSFLITPRFRQFQ